MKAGKAVSLKSDDKFKLYCDLSDQLDLLLDSFTKEEHNGLIAYIDKRYDPSGENAKASS